MAKPVYSVTPLTWGTLRPLPPGEVTLTFHPTHDVSLMNGDTLTITWTERAVGALATTNDGRTATINGRTTTMPQPLTEYLADIGLACDDLGVELEVLEVGNAVVRVDGFRVTIDAAHGAITGDELRGLLRSKMEREGHARRAKEKKAKP